MAQQRIKGQEVTVIMSIDNKVDDKVGPFTDMTATLRKEIIEGEYLGQTTTFFDDVFKGCMIELTYHMRAARILKIIDRDIKRARFQTGGLVRADISAQMAFPGQVVPYNFLDVRFDEHPLTVSDRKSYVEGKLKAYASENPTLPKNI